MQQQKDITLPEILLAREERVEIQTALLQSFGAPVVCFTMNMAGPVKLTPASHRAFLWGMDQLRLGFVQNRFAVLHERCRSLPTGDEGYFAVNASAQRIKALCVQIEQSLPMGRLFDMDVIGPDGRKLERGQERACLVCGEPGRACASRRLHTVLQLQTATAELLTSGLFDLARRRLTAAATRALLEEVAVTPKPGLVDRANNGAHRDMDLSSFQASAATLGPYWDRCFLAGRAGDKTPSALFAALRPLGMQAERDMLAATGGVNTHKGAIFTLGILCAALGVLWSADEGFSEPEAVLDLAAAMTSETLLAELETAAWHTAGESLYRRYGARGIRGQVADGLPAVRELALPELRALLAKGYDRNHAAAVTLLHLIAAVEDTNLLHRGGPDGAMWARQAAAALIRVGRVPELSEIAALDGQFIARNLSPGGCADLLAVTLFFDHLHPNTKTHLKTTGGNHNGSEANPQI